MKSVAELHMEHPYNQEERYWGYSVPLTEVTAMADELHTRADPVAYLDSLLDSDYAKAKGINRALLFLPPEIVYENFGHEVAAWIATNISSMGEDAEINSILESRANYNLKDLETSRLWQWNKNYNSYGKHILANYELMCTIKNGALDEIDLEKLLIDSAHPDIPLSAKRLADYALIPLELMEYNTSSPGGRVRDWSRDVSDNVGYDMWLDAPTGFALTYKGVPNAMAGLAMQNPDELMLYQIQGVQGNKLDPDVSRYSKERVIGKVKSRGLAPIDWQKLLVTTTESLGQNQSLRNIGIQAGKNNHWVKPHRRDEEAHITLDTAERTYDTTAKRMGYTQNSDDSKMNWHKTIQ